MKNTETPKPQAPGQFAEAHGSAQVIVYCGRHYGRPHAILSDNGRVLVAVHLPTGDVIHAPHCDCERIAPNDQAHPQPRQTC